MIHRVLILSLLAAFLAGCANAPVIPATSVNAASRVKAGKRMMVRTTAYTHTEAGGRNNACGERLRFGGDTYSAAADWSWLPLGTRFHMPCTGRNYVIEDYGSALVGRRTIDLYMPSRHAMNQWGMRHVEIVVLEWGSRTMSLKLLEPRQRNAHVRVMVAGLKGKKVEG